MSATTTQDSPLARGAVRLAALWLAVGAFAKLVYGNPTLLPEVIRNHTPLTLGLTYTLVIGIEFSLVGLCFLRPRQAWPLMVGLFAFFEFVLTTQLAAGAKSCGCFGTAMTVSPVLMMCVDSALLLGLLAARPWSAIRSRGAGIGLVLGMLVLAFAAPALWIRARQSEGPKEPPPGQNPPPTKQPDWLELYPEKWVGKSVYDIAELAKYVPQDKLPTDGRIVLWRQGCTHCAKHLREMANGDKGEQPILLVQIRDDSKDGRAVDAMPQGAHVAMAEFPEGLSVVLKTPWDLTVAGGNVTEAHSPDELDPEEH